MMQNQTQDKPNRFAFYIRVSENEYARVKAMCDSTRCTAQDLEAKRQAILTYVSQISSLWPSSAAFEADFEAFHRSEKGPGEWIWSRKVHD